MLTIKDIELLCEEGESNKLDFKREVYLWKKAESDYVRSELIKDVLAFANSRRTEPAYILCGVDAADSGCAYVCGVDESTIPDDATVQEVVSAKLNRAVPFSTYTVRGDGRSVWVVEFAPCLDQRPFFAKVDFGKLKKNDVWMRQGSSSRLATPDDVAKMVRDQVAVATEAAFDVKLRILTQKGHDGEVFSYRLTSDVTKENSPLARFYFMQPPPTDYEQFEYLRDRISRIPVAVDIVNTSATPAEDVRIVVSVESNDSIARVVEDAALMHSQAPASVREVASLAIANSRPLCVCPGEPATDAKKVFLIAEDSGPVCLRVIIYCKQLRRPQVVDFPMVIKHAEVAIHRHSIRLFAIDCCKDWACEKLIRMLVERTLEASDMSHVDWEAEGRRITDEITYEIAERVRRETSNPRRYI